MSHDFSNSKPTLRLASPQVALKCPPLLRNVAEEMAGVFYDVSKRSDMFRKRFPRQRHYVKEHWHEFVEQARDSLLQMLHSPAYNAHVKNEIYDAITNKSDNYVPGKDELEWQKSIS